LLPLKVCTGIQELLDISDTERIMEKTTSSPVKKDRVQLSDTEKGYTNLM